MLGFGIGRTGRLKSWVLLIAFCKQSVNVNGAIG